jgi:uncharacterized coiled-coil DUF342 family protein
MNKKPYSDRRQSVDESHIKTLTVKIMALKEERDGYRKEIKRLREDIDGYDMLRDQAIMSNQTQIALGSNEEG